MKRTALLMLMLLALSLTGCSRYPDRADDGAAWDRDWEMLGTAMGVETPGDGLTLAENAVVLAADDTYYATWTVGESRPYVNEDGDEIDLYPAQMYLLLYGCENAARAGDAVADWIERESVSYAVKETRTESYNGQEYTLLIYDVASETNPYARGVSAFGVFEHYAVVAEFSCTDDFTGDEQAIMARFLGGCHYSAAAVRS